MNKNSSIFVLLAFFFFSNFAVFRAEKIRERNGRKKNVDIIFDNDNKFILSGGEEVKLEEIDISIKFGSILSDSRCPQDPSDTVRCITAGSASVQVEILDGWVAKNSGNGMYFPTDGDDIEKEKYDKLGLSKVVLKIPGNTEDSEEEKQSSITKENIFTTEKGHIIELLEVKPYPMIDVNEDTDSIMRSGGISDGDFDSAYAGPSTTLANTDEEENTRTITEKQSIVIQITYNKDYTDFLNARSKWELREITGRGYTVYYSKSCFCPPEWTAEMFVNINSKGQIASATYSKEPMLGQEVRDNVKDYIPTIDEMFETIEDAFATSAAQIFVRYDYLYGYPLSTAIDRDFMMADEEEGHMFHGLQPANLKSSTDLPSGSINWSKRAIKKELKDFVY